MNKELMLESPETRAAAELSLREPSFATLHRALASIFAKIAREVEHELNGHDTAIEAKHRAEGRLLGAVIEAITPAVQAITDATIQSGQSGSARIQLGENEYGLVLDRVGSATLVLVHEDVRDLLSLRVFNDDGTRDCSSFDAAAQFRVVACLRTLAGALCAQFEGRRHSTEKIRAETKRIEAVLALLR